MDRTRIALYDRAGNSIGDLSREGGTLLSRVRSEEINGEHSLSITSTEHLEVGTRAVTQDFCGKMHEWVLDEADEMHDGSGHSRSYHFSWSLQDDLKWVRGPIRQPGMSSPVNAKAALQAALAGTSRWSVGTVDVIGRTGIVMAYDSAWDRLNTVVKHWGGEVDVEIGVDDFGVTSRKVCLRKHIGSTSAIRRFEWGHNLTSIRRTPSAGPYFCRLIPYGNGESATADDGTTTFSTKLEISSVNGGRNYLSDESSELLFRVSDGNGGWEYPTTTIDYSTDDVSLVLQYGKEDYESLVKPTISYEGTVSQFAAAGMDVEGVELGDEVQIVDYGFDPDIPLLLTERVIRIEADEFGSDDIRLTVGKFRPSLERMFKNLVESIGEVQLDDQQLDPIDLVIEIPDPIPAPDPIPIPDPDPIPPYDEPVIEYKFDDSKIQANIGDIYSRIGEIESFVSAISDYDFGGGSVSDIGTDFHIDGWTHMIDGVEKSSGTVDFRTTSSSFAIEMGQSAAAQGIAAAQGAVKKALAKAWGASSSGSSSGGWGSGK